MNGMLILLGILKGIGLVLLALLILVLLLMLLVLFSPIRYRLAGQRMAELSGSFAVSWIFGAIRADGSYSPADSLQYRVKLLWFTVIGGEPKQKKSKRKKAKPMQQPSAQPDISAAEKTAEEKKPTEPLEPPPSQPQPPKEQPQKQPEEPPKARKQPSLQQMERMQPKTMRRVKLAELAEPPEDSLEDIADEGDAFFSDEPEQRAEKKGRFAVIRQIFSEIEDKKGICRALARLIRRLCRGVLPGQLFLKGTFGTGDPTTTGYLLALAGVLTAKFGNDIRISGDFTKAAAEDIEVRLQGRILLGGLLWAVLAFLLTRPVRRAIQYAWKKRKAMKGQGEANG